MEACSNVSDNAHIEENCVCKVVMQLDVLMMCAATFCTALFFVSTSFPCILPSKSSTIPPCKTVRLPPIGTSARKDLCLHETCRTIEAATVEILYRLGELAANTLTSVVTEDPGTRRLARRLAIGSNINIVFLQAIKDAALHSALMKLKAQV